MTSLYFAVVTSVIISYYVLTLVLLKFTRFLWTLSDPGPFRFTIAVIGVFDLHSRWNRNRPLIRFWLEWLVVVLTTALALRVARCRTTNVPTRLYCLVYHHQPLQPSHVLCRGHARYPTMHIYVTPYSRLFISLQIWFRDGIFGRSILNIYVCHFSFS